MVKKTAKLMMCFILVLSLTLTVPAYLQTDSTVSGAKIKISITKKNLIVGQTLKLSVKGTKKKVKWSSSRKTVAKVSSKGNVKALKKGTAYIYAKVGKKILKCKVTVVKPYLNIDNTWLIPGQTEKIKLKNATKEPIWSSTNEKVATVVDGEIGAISEGKATIKATVGSKVYKCKVEVLNKEMKDTIKNIKGAYNILCDIRSDYRLKKLKLNFKLCEAAMVRAKEISKVFEHSRPDGSSCFTVFKEYGFKVYTSRGENIAYGFTTPHKVMDAWMNSPAHKARIVDSSYETTGFGYYFDEKSETCYWVELFYQK